MGTYNSSTIKQGGSLQGHTLISYYPHLVACEIGGSCCLNSAPSLWVLMVLALLSMEEASKDTLSEVALLILLL